MSAHGKKETRKSKTNTTMKTMIELFCGTKSMAKTFKKNGYEVYTIDINEQFKPDSCKSVLDLELKDLPKKFRNPTVIWASPPCNSFSVLTIGRYWSKPNRPKHYRAFIGMALVMKTLQLIDELKPKYWFIENPRGMLRKTYFMENLHRKTVTYCQYGKQWRKPTDIWTNAASWIPRCCKPSDSCHEKVSRGENDKGIVGIQRVANWDGSGSIIRAELPVKLCEEIVKVCEDKMPTKQETLN